jgi:hypothetical protein
MAIKVDGHYSFGARRNRTLDQLGIKIKRLLVDIDVNRLGPSVGNCPTSRHERTWRGNHLISRPYAQEKEGNVQRRGPAIEADAMLRAAKPSKGLLELRHVRSEAKGAIIQSPSDSCVNFLAQGSHLGGKIEVRDCAIFLSQSCHFLVRLIQSHEIKQPGKNGEDVRKNWDGVAVGASSWKEELAGGSGSVVH